MPLPKGVFRIRKPSGLEYWYHQSNRGKPEAGPITRLPDYGRPEFWRAIAGLTEQEVSIGSMREVVDAYRLGPRFTGLAPNSRRTYEFALSEILAAWGKLHSGDITPAGVAALIDALSDRPGIANLTLSVVRVLMKESIRKGYRTDNPAREIEGISADVDGAKPLTAEAWQSLMQAPEDVKRLAILGRATGQRISDLVSMSPRMRDQDGITTGIKKIKESSHWCPLTRDQIATMDGWNVFKNAAYAMRTDGKRHTTNSARIAWNDWLSTDDGEPCRGFTPHDLRATKVCDERIAGKSHQQISAMIGMSMGMVMRYSKHIDKRLVARGSGTRTEQDL